MLIVGLGRVDAHVSATARVAWDTGVAAPQQTSTVGEVTAVDRAAHMFTKVELVTQLQDQQIPAGLCRARGNGNENTARCARGGSYVQMAACGDVRAHQSLAQCAQDPQKVSGLHQQVLACQKQPEARCSTLAG